MHGQIQYIAVFAISLFAALGVGNLIATWVSDWRRDRASRVAIARLNWRGETQDEVEQPGWTDEQMIAAAEYRLGRTECYGGYGKAAEKRWAKAMKATHGSGGSGGAWPDLQWTDEQIAAYDKMKAVADPPRRIKLSSELPTMEEIIGFRLAARSHASLPVEPREQWPPDGLGVSRVAVDGPVTLLGDESDVEQERRLR